MRLVDFGFCFLVTYRDALKSISMTKSIDALLTLDKARALTMQVLSFRLHSGYLP